MNFIEGENLTNKSSFRGLLVTLLQLRRSINCSQSSILGRENVLYELLRSKTLNNKQLNNIKP